MEYSVPSLNPQAPGQQKKKKIRELVCQHSHYWACHLYAVIMSLTNIHLFNCQNFTVHKYHGCNYCFFNKKLHTSKWDFPQFTNGNLQLNYVKKDLSQLYFHLLLLCDFYKWLDYGSVQHFSFLNGSDSSI